MNKGKTNYTFQFSADSAVVEGIVKAWLNTNKFSLVNKFGEEYYYFNDPVLYGKRGFQYKIDGNTISVDAWTIGIGKKYYMLTSGMAGDSYKGILQNLFNKICEAKNDSMAVNSSTDSTVQQVEKIAGEFETESTAKREKMCVAGFVLSIIGLILPFIGASFGIIVYVLDFYFASQGIPTSKKKMAIATIIITTISLLISIVSFIFRM